MSRAALLKRLDELEARLLEAYVDPWSRFLESLSDEELEALERETEPGLACVHHGTGDFIEGCDCLDRARELQPGGLSEIRFLAYRLHRGEEALLGQRSAPEPVAPIREEPSPDRAVPSAAEEPPEPLEAQGSPEDRSPEASDPPPRIRLSTDLPESKAEERARLFELDTVRVAEPGDTPGWPRRL